MLTNRHSLIKLTANHIMNNHWQAVIGTVLMGSLNRGNICLTGDTR